METSVLCQVSREVSVSGIVIGCRSVVGGGGVRSPFFGSD
jgi:hypothetical protein